MTRGNRTGIGPEFAPKGLASLGSHTNGSKVTSNTQENEIIRGRIQTRERLFRDAGFLKALKNRVKD